MADKSYYRPILPLVVALIAGIAAGYGVSGHRFFAYCIIIILIPAVSCSIIKNKSCRFLPLLLFIALGYLLIQPWTAPQFASNHIINFVNKPAFAIEGTIQKILSQRNNRMQLVLSVERIRIKKKPIRCTGKIRLSIHGKPIHLSKGMQIAFSAKIRPLRNFHNPGGFNYEKYMGLKGIFAGAYVRSQEIDRIGSNPNTQYLLFLGQYRNRIGQFIQSTLGEKGQGVLTALIIGDRKHIPQKLSDAFKRAGASHILAISGLHIGILTTLAFLFFTRLLSYFNWVIWHARAKKLAAILTLVPIVAYGFLAGMSPPTQRAVIMVSIFLATYFLAKRVDSLNVLAIAAMVLLILWPPFLFSISFQLSFCAVFFIILGLSKTQNQMPNRMALSSNQIYPVIRAKLIVFLEISLLAILGTLPLLMFYFNQISTVGLVANLLIIPLIGFVAVPLGLTAVFFYPISLNLAAGCIKISAAVLDLAIAWITFLSGFSFAAVKTVTPNYIEIFAYYILLLSALNLFECHKKPSQNQLFYKRKTWRFIILLTLAILSADLVYWLNQRFFHDDLKITIVDVGQGSCALLEIPGGKRVLIDGGGFADNSAFDVGQRIVAPFLWRKKIKTLDLIILTHPESDHLNGLLYIARNFTVKTFWSNHDINETQGYAKLMEALHVSDIDQPVFQTIYGDHKFGKVCVEILYPPKTIENRPIHTSQKIFNDRSLITKVTLGTVSILFPGDILKHGEKKVVTHCGSKLGATILLAPHHGSRSSSSPLFLAYVKPKYVIISAGWQNRFNFPHPQVIKRYEKMGCRIFRTDLQGAVTLSTDGVSLSIKTTI
jgi:competence protein ComEC